MHSTEKANIHNFVTSLNGDFGYIVVYGPTASGKTNLSIDIALYIAEHTNRIPYIISADSRQIYTGMDIGTGKITTEEMQGIPHYGLDIITPDQSFSVAEFREYIEDTIQKQDAATLPIICGGTGLYVDSLLFSRDYTSSGPNPKRRAELEQIRQEHGNQAVWDILHRLDPDYAEELHPNNHTYIIRAIEVFEYTGRSKKDVREPLTLRYPTYFVTPYTDSPENREALYNRINTRVQGMFQNGLVDEVRALCLQYGDTAPGLTTIGYKEIIPVLRGEYSLQDAENLVAQHSRNYAKRQISWNKKYVML